MFCGKRELDIELAPCLFQYGHDGKPVPFDTAMARWHALHATYEERYVPRAKNLAFAFFFCALPIAGHFWYTTREKVM